MNFNLVKIKEGVDLRIDNHSVCVFVKSQLFDNKIISDNISANFKQEENKITFELLSSEYDIINLKFDKIKKIKDGSYYVEIDEQFISIQCEKASLISDKNLVISVNGIAEISFEAQSPLFKTSTFSALSLSSDNIYEKNLPSFSITFYRDFQNNEFSGRFDSYKDRQVISTETSSGIEQSVVVFVKIISHFVDNLPAGTVNVNYQLALYFDFYTNPGNKRLAPLTKVQNSPEGSIYFAQLSFTIANYVDFFDGLRECRVEVNKFIFQNTIGIKANIAGGPSSPPPSPNVNASQDTLTALPSQNCCYQFLTQFVSSPGTEPIPSFTPSWPSLTWQSDTQGYLYDYLIPETTTNQKTSFTTSASAPYENGNYYVGIKAKYDLLDLNYRKYNWLSLFFVSYSDIQNSNLNLSSYILDFYYYYDGLEQPDIFTACGDDGSVLSFTNTDVNDGGLYNTTCYGVQFYYDFRSNLRNDKILSKFEVQLQKTTTTFPNEFRLYDFKIFSISCSPLPTPSPSPSPTEVPIVIESYDITSTNPLAVRISNQPSDNNSISSGTTQYIVRYNSDTSIQITAPLTGYFVDRNTFQAKQYTFNYWLLNNFWQFQSKRKSYSAQKK